MVDKAKAKLSTTKGKDSFMPGELWHHRLGHVGSTSLLKKKLKELLGKDYRSFDKLCKGCINAKAHDVPSQFEGSAFKANRVGQQVLFDAFSFDRRDRSGYKYCVIVLDDYSDYKFCLFLKKLSELEEKLKLLIQRIERHLYTKIEGLGTIGEMSPEMEAHLKGLGVSRLKSDGAAVNATKSFRRWCENRGTENYWNVADNPKTASRIERAVRTVVEGSEAIRFGANMPVCYWSDCVRSFVWIHNRMPSKVKKGKSLTPYEEYFSDTVPFKKLVKPMRRIGCKCYSVDPHYRRSKKKRRSQPKGELCVFLGYVDYQKGWVVQSLATGKVFISAHVYFDESQLVFKANDETRWLDNRRKEIAYNHNSFRLATNTYDINNELPEDSSDNENDYSSDSHSSDSVDSTSSKSSDSSINNSTSSKSSDSNINNSTSSKSSDSKANSDTSSKSSDSDTDNSSSGDYSNDQVEAEGSLDSHEVAINSHSDVSQSIGNESQESVENSNIEIASNNHESSDSNSLYEVEDIVAYRKTRGGNQYLVKWKDYDELSFAKTDELSSYLLEVADEKIANRKLPYARTIDTYKYHKGLERDDNRSGGASDIERSSSSGGASQGDSDPSVADNSCSESEEKYGAQNIVQGSDVDSKEDKTYLDESDDKRDSQSEIDLTKEYVKIDCVKRQFGNRDIVRGYRILKTRARKDSSFKRRLDKRLSNLSHSKDADETSYSESINSLDNGEAINRQTVKRLSKVYMVVGSKIAHKGKAGPDAEVIRQKCESLLKGLSILRDRSLRIPSTRADMLRQSEDAVALYKVAEGVEVKSFYDLGVWHLVERPKGKNVMKVRWVYDHKFDDQGKLLRMKARIVAKGFTQVYGHDYTETFSPTVRFKTFIILCTIKASSKGSFKADLWDVSTAFLNADADAEMYCEQPAGWEVEGKPKKSWVYKLDKTIYGTKQAGRNWHIHLKGILSDLGFVQSRADECLFTLTKKGKYMYILVHVDDMAVFYDCDDLYEHVFKKINAKVICKSSKGLSMFLGVRIIHNFNGSIELSQEHYIDTLAERFNQAEKDWIGVSLPYASTVRLTSSMRPQNDEERAYALTLPYQELVGALNYLRITRPELAYSMSQLGKWMSDWGVRHWKAAIQHLRYTIKTKAKTLVVRPIIGSPIIKAWVDSDFFGDRDPGQSDVGASHGGYVTMVCGDSDAKDAIGNVVSVRSKKHNVITLSSMEAEIREATTATKEILYLRELLKDLGYVQDRPSVLFEDNSGCISFSKNATHHENTKHVVLRYYWLKMMVDDGVVVLEKVHSSDNIADIFTKPLRYDLFIKHASKLLGDSARCNVVMRLQLLC